MTTSKTHTSSVTYQDYGQSTIRGIAIENDALGWTHGAFAAMIHNLEKSVGKKIKSLEIDVPEDMPDVWLYWFDDHPITDDEFDDITEFIAETNPYESEKIHRLRISTLVKTITSYEVLDFEDDEDETYEDDED